MSFELDRVYCGDSQVLIKNLADDSIDIIITSPPYNLGNDHHTGNKRHNPYDDNLPENEYQASQIAMLNEMHRVLKPNGSLFYNHKVRIKKGQAIHPMCWINNTPFVLQQEIVWVNRSQNFDKRRFYPWTERVYWLTKQPNIKLQNIINKPDYFTWDDWKPVGTKESHTRAFPEKMVEDILSCFPESEIVFDPYVGGGTTCCVAKKMKKRFIGFDINPDYCELSTEKIRSIAYV